MLAGRQKFSWAINPSGNFAAVYSRVLSEGTVCYSSWVILCVVRASCWVFGEALIDLIDCVITIHLGHGPPYSTVRLTIPRI